MVGLDFFTLYALLLAVLVSGGVAVYGTFRWYRTLKKAPSNVHEDLAQLRRALKEHDLGPEEAARILAAIDRQKRQGDQLTG